MPGDDIEPMLVLYNLLHYHYSAVPNPPGLELATSVAKLCDKYDCMNTLSFVSKVWLRELVPKSGKLGRSQVIVIAYLLDDPIAFQQATRDFLLHFEARNQENQENHANHIEHDLVDPDNLLPSRFWGKSDCASSASGKYYVLPLRSQEQQS